MATAFQNTNETIPRIQQVAVDELMLDYENPRLSSGSTPSSEMDILKTLWTEMSVDEVALSIAANGFFQEEALFAIPIDQKVKASRDSRYKYVVIEGNRRLAAVLLLRDKELRSKIRATDLPQITEKEKNALAKLPVAIYESRKELWTYLGFRHINGPKPWDAFSKAKYVADVKNNFGVSLVEIARRISDRHSTVKKLYRGYEVLAQAERAADFDKEDRTRNKFYFSHLYTALDQGQYQKFLGIDSEGSLKENPVPKSKLKELRELMIWIYGSKSANKLPIVQSQNPDLNLLRDVIVNKQALSALRSGVSLHKSFDIARGDSRRFQDSLSRAKEELIEASGTVTLGYKGDDEMLRVALDIVEISQSLLTSMQSKLKRSNRL